MTPEKSLISLFPVERRPVEQRSYDELVADARLLAVDLQVPDEVVDTTLFLVDILRQHDEKTAVESLQDMPVALMAADEYADYYNVDVNYGYVWSASLLHDIGKLGINRELLEKSNAGIEWTDENREIMKFHAAFGAWIAEQMGLPQVVSRAIAESHGKQLGSPEYGVCDILINEERTPRDSLAAADFAVACLKRTNSRNRGKSKHARMKEVFADIAYLYGDYSDSEELIRRIATRITTQKFYLNRSHGKAKASLTA